MGKVGTGTGILMKRNTYHTTSVQVISNVIPTIPTIPRYFEIWVPYHTGSIRYFQMSYQRYQRYHGILRFRYLTIPARPGIFNSHTHDTNDTPVFWDFDTLTYRLDQVFSTAIPTIPTIPRCFEISIPYHTGSIRFFQLSYPRYRRVPRYGISRLYTLGMPGTVPYPRFL